METVARLPGDLGLIPIAEALKSATSRTGGKPNVIARGPELCSPGISRARSRIGPGGLATVSNYWVVTDVTLFLDDMYTKFGKDNVRLITRGIYSIHDSAGTVIAILVKSAPAE